MTSLTSLVVHLLTLDTDFDYGMLQQLVNLHNLQTVDQGWICLPLCLEPLNKQDTANERE